MLNEIDQEFLPLPYYNWEVRPANLQLDDDECATSLYLSDGVIEDASRLLRVPPLRLTRAILRSPRLARLHRELAALLNDRVLKEYRDASKDSDSRRREWAASKIAQTRQFQDHPLAPLSNAAPQTTGPSVGGGRIIISWESDAPLLDVTPDSA